MTPERNPYKELAQADKARLLIGLIDDRFARGRDRIDTRKRAGDVAGALLCLTHEQWKLLGVMVGLRTPPSTDVIVLVFQEYRRRHIRQLTSSPYGRRSHWDDLLLADDFPDQIRARLAEASRV